MTQILAKRGVITVRVKRWTMRSKKGAPSKKKKEKIRPRGFQKGRVRTFSGSRASQENLPLFEEDLALEKGIEKGSAETGSGKAADGKQKERLLRMSCATEDAPGLEKDICETPAMPGTEVPGPKKLRRGIWLS